MFAKALDIELALEKEPERVRTWTYAPSRTQKIGSKDGQLFFVCEKGSSMIQLTVRVKDTGLEVTLSQDKHAEFSRKDTEQAMRLIGDAIAREIQSQTPAEDQLN